MPQREKNRKNSSSLGPSFWSYSAAVNFLKVLHSFFNSGATYHMLQLGRLFFLKINRQSYES
ncbi:hypothetical protein AMI01nite_35060 [Aneurinibacillus migulanus]|nr:hypothetical protein AMI01nite_35060 [Aneurinibacillus migulanus]